MKLSLKLKTLAVVTTLIIVSATILSVAHTSRQRAMLKQELERLTEAFAHNLAFNSEYGVLVGDRHGLQDLVDGILQDRDVAYAAVFDREFHRLAKGERSQADRLIETALRPEPSAQMLLTYVGAPKAPICLVQHPVMLMRQKRWNDEGMLFPTPSGSTDQTPELIGIAVVGLSTQSVTAYLKEVQRTTLVLTALIVLVAWSLSYMLVSFLTNPLRELKAATEQVAAGNLDVRLRRRTQDEVGDLTQSFNQMVDEIRQSRNRIEDYTRQLEVTAKELTNLNLEMEDLLRVVSHDLRAPLINIQGFSRRLEPLMQETVNTLGQLSAQSHEDGLRTQMETLRSTVQARFAESLRFISKGVEKMDTLLSLLLAISRVGRKADPVQPNDLDAILDDVLITFDHQLKERAIEVIRHPLPKGVPCRRNEINQVFSNLASNAINYMGPSDQRFIEIGGVTRDNEVECFVKDTGIGISPEDQERVFQMFTRLQAVEAPGEGIGLAYVKKILRSHGGRIWVSSARGQGSTFFFTLPLQPVTTARG